MQFVYKEVTLSSLLRCKLWFNYRPVLLVFTPFTLWGWSNLHQLQQCHPAWPALQHSWFADGHWFLLSESGRSGWWRMPWRRARRGRRGEARALCGGRRSTAVPRPSACREVADLQVTPALQVTTFGRFQRYSSFCQSSPGCNNLAGLGLSTLGSRTHLKRSVIAEIKELWS